MLLLEPEGVKVGNWTVSTTDLTTYNGIVSRIPAGNGEGTITWATDLPATGYYAIYAWTTRGGSDRARNAPYTVSSGGQSKTYLVDQTPTAQGWRHLGIQKLVYEGIISDEARRLSNLTKQLLLIRAYRNVKFLDKKEIALSF